jgi:hypothetical protein
MLKDILDNLAPEQRNQLMHAFEHGFCQIVHLPDNKFIGVNLHARTDKNFKIEEIAGSWAYGQLKEK